MWALVVLVAGAVGVLLWRRRAATADAPSAQPAPAALTPLTRDELEDAATHASALAALLDRVGALNVHVIAKEGSSHTSVADDGWTVRGAPGELSALATAMVCVEREHARALTPRS